uniref:Uncharacterized protein n=1 Tax=Panagrolaimus superbus TaxID=310955 RepID=A0A914Y1F2_9BILA
MTFLKIFLILAFCVTVSQSIRCFTCENDSCGRPQGYATEDCGPHVPKCYILKNISRQVYRVGCLATKCDDISKHGDNCDECDSDNCNGQLMANPPIGAGTNYNSANTLSFFNAIIFALISSVIGVFIYV